MLSVLVNLMAPSSFRGLSAVLMFGPPSPLSLYPVYIVLPPIHSYTKHQAHVCTLAYTDTCQLWRRASISAPSSSSMKSNPDEPATCSGLAKCPHIVLDQRTAMSYTV